MTNQAKQLEMDFGMLTVAQQDRVDSFVKSQQQNTERLILQQAKIENLLISGGFVPGIDYINNLEYSMVTENREFGYGDNEFKADVTYMRSSGGCNILFDRYNQYTNTLETKNAMVGAEHDKLQCSNITPQYRAYKPASLFTKLRENNEKAQSEYDSANREQAVIKYTVNKYKTLFPKATVTVGKDYYKTRNDFREFPTVIVAFESGSYIIFRLGYENDKEYTHKKFDAIASKLDVIELLNVFNQQ